jgi:DNA-binding NtrC family response regulator
MNETIPSADVPPESPLVLVVDDEPSIRTLLRAILMRAGYRVLVFDCGDEILLSPRQPLTEAVCAFVDDAFPGRLNGPQTMAMLHLINPAMKIVPMLGRAWTEPEKAWIKPHLPNTLYKPFRAEEVLRAVSGVVAARQLPGLPGSGITN